METIQKNQKIVIYPIILWLIILVSTLVLTLIFRQIILPGHITLNGFHSWDGNIYLTLAKYFYSKKAAISPFFKGRVDGLTPFFPLFPLLIRALHQITHWRYALCGFLISNIAFSIALIYFYKLNLLYFNAKTSRYALWLLICFPAAFFFNMTYTESLTLCFTVMFFYFLQTQSWYKAILAGFLAAGLHTLGFILAPVALFYWWRHRHEWGLRSKVIRFLSIGFIGLGLFAYLLYLQLKFSNAFEFLIAEKYWYRVAVIPIFNLFTSMGYQIHHLIKTGLNARNFVAIMNGCSALVIVYFGFKMLFEKIHTIPVEMKLFFWLTLLCTISSNSYGSYSLLSYSRFMIVLFPAFMIWANSIKDGSRLMLCLISMLAIKTVLLGMFIDGYVIS